MTTPQRVWLGLQFRKYISSWKEGVAERARGFMCWPGNRMGNVWYNILYVLVESLLWGSLRGPGDNMKASDLSLYHGIRWSHSCLRLVGKLFTCQAISQAPLFPFGPVWDSLPGNTFTDTPRGAPPSSAQSSQVDSAWPLPSHSPSLAIEVETGKRRGQAK